MDALIFDNLFLPTIGNQRKSCRIGVTMDSCGVIYPLHILSLPQKSDSDMTAKSVSPCGPHCNQHVHCTCTLYMYIVHVHCTCTLYMYMYMYIVHCDKYFILLCFTFWAFAVTLEDTLNTEHVYNNAWWI